MNERWPAIVRLAPLGLLALIAVAWVLPAVGGLQLASADDDPASEWAAALDGLPRDPVVLVGYDPDLGTFAEVRPTVRVALADLLNRDARLVFVSLTPEGRALALAELDRLARADTDSTRLLDLGFRPGAEAALVALVRDPLGPSSAQGTLARTLADEGIGGIDATLVVGGNDLGPRTWVEQLQPRVDGLPILAIAPTSLLPELLPYTETGQLEALLATPRDGAAYRDQAELGPLDRLRETPELPVAAVAIGMVIAVGVLGQAWGARLAGHVRGSEPGDAA